MADVVIPGRAGRANTYLRALTLSTSLATVGTSFVANVLGVSKDSTLSLGTNPGNRYQIARSGDNYQLIGYGPTLAVGTDSINLVETPAAGTLGGSRTSAVSVSASPLMVLSGSVGSVGVGEDFSFTPTISGGSGPIKFSLGSPHRGLAIDSATGRVYNTRKLDTLGPRLVSINAVDAAGAQANFASVLNVGTSAAPATPTVSISSNISQTEGNSGPKVFTYTVARSAATGAVSIPWTFAAGGTSAADFTGGVLPTGGNVNLADGVSSGTFQISVNGDTTVEVDETFTVTLGVPAGYGAGTPMIATGTILNDDSGGGSITLPLYARSVWLGNSIISQSVGAGMKSMQLRTVGRSAGRMILTQSGDKGIPGTKFVGNAPSGDGSDDTIISRIPRVAEQMPDIVFVEGGHNEGPGGSGKAGLLTSQLSARDALRTALPNAVIVWQTILPSASEGTDSTALANLAEVNNARMGWNGMDGGKTLVVDVHTGFDYNTMTQLVAGSPDGIHLNGTGARFVAARLDTAVASMYPSTSIDTILAEQGAVGDHGANLYSSTMAAMTGTAGTRSAGITFSVLPTANDTVTINGVTITFVASGATGAQVNIGATTALTATALNTYVSANTTALGITSSTVSGSIVTVAVAGTGTTPTLASAGTTPPLVGKIPTGTTPDSFDLANNTGATVAVSLDTSQFAGKGYNIVQIDITGTVTAEGLIVFGNRLPNATYAPSANVVSGDWLEALYGRSITSVSGGVPAGIRSYGIVVPTTPTILSEGNYTTPDTANGVDLDVSVPIGVSRGYPKAISTAITKVGANFGLRVSPGTVDIRLRLFQPIIRKTFLTAKYKPIFSGEDYIKSPSEKLGLASGTVSNGNTLTFRYGAVDGGGVTMSGIRIYSGGTSGGITSGGRVYGNTAGIGTGTLLATLPAGTMTWTAAGLPASGQAIHIEVDATNSFGTTTGRSTSVTVS